MSTPEQTAPKVFISYSHDSKQHEENVRALAERLRSEGVECVIDQYITTPAEGWPRWMMNQIEAADFVLVVATEAYNRRFRGKEEPNRGFGAQWEGAVITQELYDGNGQNLKFVPAVFNDSDLAHIPIPLRSATHYNVADNARYDALYYYLTHQPPYVPPIGPRRQRPQTVPSQEILGTARDGDGAGPASQRGEEGGVEATPVMLTRKLNTMHEHQIDELINSFMNPKEGIDPWKAVTRSRTGDKINDFVRWVVEEGVLEEACKRAMTNYPR